MDAHGLLRSQGWRGLGHTLHATDDNTGLARPLLLSRKDDRLGLGSQNVHASAAAVDQWWLNAFDQHLKGLKPGVKRTGAEATKSAPSQLQLLAGNRGANKYRGAYGLHAHFVRGGMIEGTINDSGESEASSDTCPLPMKIEAKDCLREKKEKKDKMAKAEKKEKKEQREKEKKDKKEKKKMEKKEKREKKLKEKNDKEERKANIEGEGRKRKRSTEEEINDSTSKKRRSSTEDEVYTGRSFEANIIKALAKGEMQAQPDDNAKKVEKKRKREKTRSGRGSDSGSDEKKKEGKKSKRFNEELGLPDKDKKVVNGQDDGEDEEANNESEETRRSKKKAERARQKSEKKTEAGKGKEKHGADNLPKLPEEKEERQSKSFSDALQRREAKEAKKLAKKEQREKHKEKRPRKSVTGEQDSVEN